jgi:serine/threonine-protein kinase 11
MCEILVRPNLIADHKTGVKPRKLKKINQYVLVDTIGYGAQSKVHLAIDADTQLPYAVKAIQMTLGASIEREVRLLRRLSHPNIIRLHEALQVKHQEIAYLVLDWASCGCLAEAAPRGADERCAARVFRQVCDGLAYLHSEGIAHRDIKPSNILLFDGGVVKLADFGIGHSFDSADTVLGTPAYQSPECFDESEDVLLDPVKEDIWSLGVSLFESVFGRLPFRGANLFEIAWAVFNRPLEVPETASPELRDLLGRMLERNPAKRISLAEVQAHPFFIGADTPIGFGFGPRRVVAKVNATRPIEEITATVCGETVVTTVGQRSSSYPIDLYLR